jgi:hypothetical protein
LAQKIQTLIRFLHNNRYMAIPLKIVRYMHAKEFYTFNDLQLLESVKLLIGMHISNTLAG